MAGRCFVRVILYCCRGYTPAKVKSINDARFPWHDCELRGRKEDQRVEEHYAPIWSLRGRLRVGKDRGEVVQRGLPLLSRRGLQVPVDLARFGFARTEL